MSIVSILCVPVGGAVLRLVSVLYSLMVEKVERLLRGQWSAFNIYGASRCSSRGGVSLIVSLFLLVFRLVGISCRRRLVLFSSSRSSLRSSTRFSFRFCLVVSLPWRVAARCGACRRRWCSLAVIWCWGGSVLFPVFRLARRGLRLMGTCRFIQLVLVLICGL